ncbi:MAG TPA: hypothetical protein VIJ87_02690 [Pyrinomonadaceae bacterium]|jgi:hypothetical protein
MTDEPLLGGPGSQPATLEEKREFRALCRRLPLLTQSELDRMQRIEWGLTAKEYNILKFGE